MKTRFWNNIWKDQSGVVMPELIAGLAIMVMVTVFAGTLLIYAEKSYARQSDRAVYLKQLELAGECISRELIYADHLEITYEPQQKDSYGHVILCDPDGSVLLDGNPVLEAAGRIHYGISIVNQEEEESVLKFRLLALNEENETLYYLDNVVKLVNLELPSASGEIRYPQTGSEAKEIDSMNGSLYIYYDRYQ